MKTRFLLKKRGSAKGATHPIYIALYDGDQTEIIYTGQRITKADWHKSERLPRDHEGEIYKEIEKVRKKVDLAKVRLEADEKPVTPFTVKQAYEALVKSKGQDQLSKDKKAKEGLRTIKALAERWTENNLFHYKPSSQKSVRESIKAFTDYLTKTGQIGLERKDLDEEIINGYAKYLLEVKLLSDNTHGKRMKQLRWFLKAIKYNEYRDIKIRSSKRTKIHLTLDELNKLEAFDVSNNPLRQKAKDFYLLGCWTGQRISDLKRFNNVNSSSGFIKLKQVKSGNNVEIPIGKVVQDILSRYGGRSPKISEQDLNSNIQTICKDAGIKRMIEFETTKGGKQISKPIEIFNVITSHTSGKTFASVVGPEVYKLTPAEVAAIIGKDLKTVLAYYNKPQTDSAIKKIIDVERAQMKIA
jgi:hypothetical protein